MLEGTWNEVSDGLQGKGLTGSQVETLRKELWDNHRDRFSAHGWTAERVGIDVFRATPEPQSLNADLVEDIRFELGDLNEDSSAGDPRYEIHCENLAGLLERVLRAVGAEVPAVPEW